MLYESILSVCLLLVKNKDLSSTTLCQASMKALKTTMVNGTEVPVFTDCNYSGSRPTININMHII